MMRRPARWVYSHAGQIALVIACIALAVTVASYSATLRASCEDRNRRDELILVGVEQVAAELDADPHAIDPLRQALAPRDCEALYPRFPV